MGLRREAAALERIVALLLALADLADLAGRRAPAIRALVYLLLRPAEAIARDFVWGGASAACVADASPGEAARLALSFRMLACELTRRAQFAAAASSPSSGAAFRTNVFVVMVDPGPRFGSPRFASPTPDTS